MPYILLTAGLAVLILSGNILVTGSVQLARYFKMSSLVIGLTIVAFGTSAPELFTSIGAAIEGASDIALGNVIGSNIANIGCILAIVALVCPIPIRNRAIGFDFLVLFSVTILLFILAYNDVIGLLEGIFLVTVLIVYTVWSIIKSKKNSNTSETANAAIKPFAALLMISASVVGLYFSSGWFVRGAREIALHWGVSERVIGVSIVAVGTSIPELTTSIIAAFRKEPDISVGNIIGSNIFNIVGVLGITAIIRPLHIVNHSIFIFDMIWVFGFSVVLLLTILPLSKGTITRWEGGLLLLLYSVYMVIIFR